MKTNIFFKNLTYAGLALAAALFLGIGLASCSKDKNKSKPQPEPEGIVLTTNKKIGLELELLFHKDDKPTVEGAEVSGEPYIDEYNLKVKYKLKAQKIIIKGQVTMFDCRKCEVTSLNVSKYPGLKELSCIENDLKALDLRKNTELVTLGCKLNKNLKELNLSQNTKLKYLYCSECALSKLDISKNIALERLFCDDNGLKKLDASNNPKLRDIGCEGNDLTDATLILKPLESFISGSLSFKKEGDRQKLSKAKVSELVEGNWNVWLQKEGGPPAKYEGED